MTTLPLAGRSFLLLQGPQSGFFRLLAGKLAEAGAAVRKVHFCGGDVFLWGLDQRDCDWYRGGLYGWVTWIGNVYRMRHVTDICVYGDWRPLHWEAVRLAHVRGIHVWVYEEGYLRSRYSTLEEDGVNGRSRLPRIPSEIHQAATEKKAIPEDVPVSNRMKDKVLKAIWHHVGNFILYPVFHRYRTHRPTCIGVELPGILRRYFTRHRRARRDAARLEAFFSQSEPYFFFPLQLNSDSQIQLYSPYVRMEEAIADVLTSFAEHAPKDARLLIKNHPLDNGLIRYSIFIESFARELGIAERVTYLESGPAERIIEGAVGVVLINSTVGLSALRLGRPVYCLGRSIYSITGLAQSMPLSKLDDFWTNPSAPDSELVADFCKVVRRRASIRGNFYSEGAMTYAAVDSVSRFAAVGASNSNLTDYQEKEVSA
ncbi:capsule biosynthesis protein [Sutterella sp.]|uniref:capsule biosynthesis protein n=1 Tax=Sutterella sp. TaxID=1981025 RepID=UPI0026E0D2CE|nr:capsular biosynthesis protein [Sutterella sp.]MDO5531764.1 capsular biosynthesis protein [Sutterella sp.]